MFVVKKKFGNITADFTKKTIKVSPKNNNVKLSPGAYEKMFFNEGDRIDLAEVEIEIVDKKGKKEVSKMVPRLALIHIPGDTIRVDADGEQVYDENGNALGTNEGRKVSTKGTFSSGSIASKLGHGKTYDIDTDNPVEEGGYNFFLINELESQETGQEEVSEFAFDDDDPEETEE